MIENLGTVFDITYHLRFIEIYVKPCLSPLTVPNVECNLGNVSLTFKSVDLSSLINHQHSTAVIRIYNPQKLVILMKTQAISKTQVKDAVPDDADSQIINILVLVVTNVQAAQTDN